MPEEAHSIISLDWLHGGDGVQFVPSVIRVVDIGTRDQIALADLRLKIRTVVCATALHRVGLPYFALANRFEN